MFSSYNAPGIRAGIPEEHYGIEAKAQRLATDCLKGKGGRHRVKFLVYRVQLVLISKTGEKLLLEKGGRGAHS